MAIMTDVAFDMSSREGLQREINRLNLVVSRLAQERDEARLRLQRESVTYGEMPERLRLLVVPHEWDNKNISEQRDYAVKLWDATEAENLRLTQALQESQELLKVLRLDLTRLQCHQCAGRLNDNGTCDECNEAEAEAQRRHDALQSALTLQSEGLARLIAEGRTLRPHWTTTSKDGFFSVVRTPIGEEHWGSWLKKSEVYALFDELSALLSPKA